MTCQKGECIMRFIINLFLRVCLLYVFTALGWMTLLWDGQRIDNAGQFIVFAFAGGLFLCVISFFVWLMMLVPTVLASVVTLGLYLVIAEAVVYTITLWVMSQVMPQVIVLHGFWLTLLCGTLLSFIQWHKLGDRQPSNV